MKLSWEKIDLGNGMTRYFVTSGEFVSHATLNEPPIANHSQGGFDASVNTDKYNNVCVTEFEFDTYELHEQAFKEFAKKVNMLIFFKPHELEEGKIRALKKMGAKQVEDTEGVTIWWNEKDKRVWKFEG